MHASDEQPLTRSERKGRDKRKGSVYSGKHVRNKERQTASKRKGAKGKT